MASKYKKIKLSDGSTMDEHRYIMEQHLGRKLTRDEVVHHKDFDKSNNDLENLQLMTREEHSKLHMLNAEFSEETKKKMSDYQKSKTMKVSRKLTDDQVREIRKLYEDGLSFRKISEIFNVDKNTISKIVRFQHYKDVS